jgi:NAD(P)H-nitrite reductase large subunit
MSNPPRGAFIQRDKKSYAIVPRISAGLVTPDFLENVARVARKYNVPLIKLTSAQRLALVGLNPEDVEKIWQELGADVGPAVGPCVHYVKACPRNSCLQVRNPGFTGAWFTPGERVFRDGFTG